MEIPNYMVLCKDKMAQLLQSSNWTIKDFANLVCVDIDEAKKLVGGEKVDKYTTRSFINYFSAGIARNYIDWKLMGIEDPYWKIRKQIVSEEPNKRQSDLVIKGECIDE